MELTRRPVGSPTGRPHHLDIVLARQPAHPLHGKRDRAHYARADAVVSQCADAGLIYRPVQRPHTLGFFDCRDSRVDEQVAAPQRRADPLSRVKLHREVSRDELVDRVDAEAHAARAAVLEGGAREQ